MVNYHGREWSLWYKTETTEGTAPTATQYLALAQMAEIRINNQTNPNAVALSGSVDFSEYKKGVNNIVFSLSFNPSSANGTAFIKNFASLFLIQNIIGNFMCYIFAFEFFMNFIIK
mgnify:CR=1 FL=1